MHFKPLSLSFIFHLMIFGLFIILVNLKISDSSFIEVPIEVFEPKEIQNLTEVQEKPKVVLKSINEPVPENKVVREVFGANRNTYTDSTVSDSQAVNAKRGNTLAKVSDTEVLKDSDVDSLPTPTEEYLVSEMPSVLSEVRPIYPPKAREERMEGSVAMDILIDEKGNVRQASFIDGPTIFRDGAMEAIKRFKFRPAKVEGQAVAVRIRYTLKFQLEY